jgi:hypothetical protein
VGFYDAQILPRFIDVALSGREFDQMRQRVTAELEGDVREIGFGSGRNVPHYPSAVTRVWAVEPAAMGRKLASKRLVGQLHARRVRRPRWPNSSRS